MKTATEIILSAIQISSVYVLFSLGLTLIFGIMRIVNFVHGHFFTLAALLLAILVPAVVAAGFSIQIAYLVATIVAIGAPLCLAWVVYVLGLSYFQRDMDGAFIFTLGMGLLLDGTFLSAFGGSVRPVPQMIEGNLSILGVPVSVQRLVLFLVAAVVATGLYWMLGNTKLGRALRAVAADHEAAMLQGIPYNRIALTGFMLASFLAAFAGVLIAPVAVVTPFIGTDYLMKGFVAVVVGGLGNVRGAIGGGLFIGLIEAVGGYYFDGSTATIAVFVLVIVVLLVRPRGILGHA